MFNGIKLALIAAVEINSHIIGQSGDLAWYIPEDLRHFKAITLKHAIIMGRKTFDSLGKPLPKRHNIVITRDESYRGKDFVTCPNIETALEVASQYSHRKNNPIMFCIGGGEIYAQLIPQADKLNITEVNMPNVNGDIYFPKIDEKQWRKTIIGDWQTSEKDSQAYRFVEYDRITN